MKSQNRIAILNILSTVILSGVTFFTSPIFSRLLGDSSYGIVSVYITWASILTILFTLQTQNTLVLARVSFSEEEQNKYQSSVMFLAMLVFLVCSALVLIFLTPIAQAIKQDELIVIFILIYAFGSFCVSFINVKYTYELKAERNFAISVGTTLATIALSLLLIANLPKEINYYGRIIAIVVTYGGFGLFVCGLILAKGKTFYNKRYWKFCIALAVPLMFQHLANLAVGHSNRIILQLMGTEAMVGQYSLAYSFAHLTYTLYTALSNSWSPYFFDNMKKQDIATVKKLSRNYLELFTVVAMGFVLLANEVYHVFASEDFWEGTKLISIFVASTYLSFLYSFPINYELFHQKTKWITIGTIFAALLNILLNYLLIGDYGITGAALATAISHGALLIFHHITARTIGSSEENPFKIRMFIPYVLAFFAIVALTEFTRNIWYVRWLVGACLGCWEAYRIFKRKTIF